MDVNVCDPDLCKWAIVRIDPDDQVSEYWECSLEVVRHIDPEGKCWYTNNPFDQCKFYERIKKKHMEGA